MFRPRLLGRYFNARNAIDNHNRMCQSYLLLDKYWVTQSGYFRFATTVALGMGIIDGKLLYCQSSYLCQAIKEGHDMMPKIRYQNPSSYTEIHIVAIISLLLW